MSSSFIKWAAAAAGSLIVAAAVPAMAAHVTHKHLVAKKHVAHALVATATPAIHAKTRTLHVTRLTAKAKARTLAAHRKHGLASTHRKVTHLTTHRHAAVDKLTAKRSNM